MLGCLRQRQVGSILEIVAVDETILAVLVRPYDQPIRPDDGDL
jgi:hypothetical protein